MTTMDALQVQQATLADLDDVATLFDRYRQTQGQPADRAAGRAFLQARFEHGQSVIFLARWGSQTLGFAQLYPSFSSTALARVYILNDLFVAEEGRRRGVASALLAAIEAYAAQFGACRLSLNVKQANTDAQQLYAARGWVQDGEFFMFHRFLPPAR